MQEELNSYQWYQAVSMRAERLKSQLNVGTLPKTTNGSMIIFWMPKNDVVLSYDAEKETLLFVDPQSITFTTTFKAANLTDAVNFLLDFNRMQTIDTMNIITDRSNKKVLESLMNEYDGDSRYCIMNVQSMLLASGYHVANEEILKGQETKDLQHQYQMYVDEWNKRHFNYTCNVVDDQNGRQVMKIQGLDARGKVNETAIFAFNRKKESLSFESDNLVPARFGINGDAKDIIQALKTLGGKYDLILKEPFKSGYQGHLTTFFELISWAAIGISLIEQNGHEE